MTSAASGQNTANSPPDRMALIGRAPAEKPRPGQSQTGEEGLMIGSFTYVLEKSMIRSDQASGKSDNTAGDDQGSAKQVQTQAGAEAGKQSTATEAASAKLVLAATVDGEAVDSAKAATGKASGTAAQAWLGIKQTATPAAGNAANPAEPADGKAAPTQAVKATAEGMSAVEQVVSEQAVATEETAEAGETQDGEETGKTEITTQMQTARASGAYAQAGQEPGIQLSRTEMRVGTARFADSEATPDARVADQVGRHLHTHLKSDLQPGTMKLSLTPPHLGRVEITFERQGDSLHMTFRVESTEAMNALRSASSDLSQLVMSKGGEWRDVTIRISQDGKEEDQGQQSGNQRQRQQRDPDRSLPESLNEWQEEDTS